MRTGSETTTSLRHTLSVIMAGDVVHDGGRLSRLKKMSIREIQEELEPHIVVGPLRCWESATRGREHTVCFITAPIAIFLNHLSLLA